MTSCPDGRISDPTVERDGRRVLDINVYIPYFLAAVNNALSRGASQRYLDKFGIGIVEWRVVAMLAIEPRISASRICEVIALDKAATSRALKRLHGLGFVVFKAHENDPRKKIWWLNRKGDRLHDRILTVALARERDLIKGVEAEDLETFLRVMRIMRTNVDRL